MMIVREGQPNPFKVLGVDQATVTLIELKKKWWELARSTHPDAGGTVEKFREVKQAYLTARNMMQKELCPKCLGQGKVQTTQGFQSMFTHCDLCSGSGYKHFTVPKNPPG